MASSSENLPQDNSDPSHEPAMNAILETFQDNIFLDIGLQTIAHILLGDAINHAPGCNVPELFLNVKFSNVDSATGLPLDDPAGYTFKSHVVGAVSLQTFTDKERYIGFRRRLISILQLIIKTKKVVAQTLRMQLALGPAMGWTSTLTCILLWIEKTEE